MQTFGEWIDSRRAATFCREASGGHDKGRRFNKAMGRWLRSRGFDRINKSDRSRLLRCADHLEPNQGKLPAMDYPLDRLVIANQLIREQQTTIIFAHLGISLMSRWQARIGDLDLRADPPGSARFASSGRQTPDQPL